MIKYSRWKYGSKIIDTKPRKLYQREDLMDLDQISVLVDLACLFWWGRASLTNTMLWSVPPLWPAWAFLPSSPLTPWPSRRPPSWLLHPQARPQSPLLLRCSRSTLCSQHFLRIWNSPPESYGEPTKFKLLGHCNIKFLYLWFHNILQLLLYSEASAKVNSV